MTIRSWLRPNDFLSSPVSGGIVLIAAAVLALVIANAPLAGAFEALLHFPIGPTLVPDHGPMTVDGWINDAAMSLFFLLVGLEIKREFVEGQLAEWRDRRLPFVAAAAGMAVPAIVYLLVTSGDAELAKGWAIPAATDIAFALGLLALLGDRIPASLKLFVTTVAIVDDVGAVAVIALFYTRQIDTAALIGAMIVLGAMIAMNRLRVTRLPAYLIGFAILWFFMLSSGIHATIAGVLAALTIPLRSSSNRRGTSTLLRLEHGLQRPVAFVVLPLFALANAGVTIGGQPLPRATLPLAIAAGLFLGKQIGVFGGIWIAARTGLAGKPKDASWTQIYGCALICGIGFTMSLFIGNLAFPTQPNGDAVKVGVLLGSLLSGIAGFVVLRLAGASRRA